ncbi:MAG: hypothetical protein Q9195_004193 [Heterodermia aff. obscurata]
MCFPFSSSYSPPPRRHHHQNHNHNHHPHPHPHNNYNQNPNQNPLNYQLHPNNPGYYEQLVNYYEGRIHPADLPAALRNGPVPDGGIGFRERWEIMVG